MTINEAITKIDAVKPNTYLHTEKVAWLSELDGRIKTEIINTHEGFEDIEFNGYSEEDVQKELIVSAPYSDIYITWLEAMIDYANNEYGKYNNSMAMFNAKYSAFSSYWNRTHMPIGTKIKYF